ncbi:MAG: hypothetical protein WC960_01535, partial [Bacteroidales bacterium]
MEAKRMKILDNKQGRTVEKEIVKRMNASSSLTVSTGMFSIYAFYFLHEKIKNIKGLRILLLSNPQTKSPQGISIALDNTFWGTTEEGGLKRQLLLRYAAEQCTHILQRSRIRTLKIPDSFGFKLIFIENDHDSCLINPGMADFYSDSLGFVNTGRPQQHILHNKKEDVAQYKQMFDSVWSDNSISKEITTLVLDELKKGFKEYSPNSVYYMILHHLFHHSIVDFADDKIFKSRTGFKDKEIWNKLYKFQKDGVMGAIEKI